MTSTLDSTFEKFFTEPPSGECIDCGGKSDLQVLYIGLNEQPVRICKTCKARRENERAQARAQEDARIAENIWRNNWEE